MFSDTGYGLNSDHQFCLLDFESTSDHLLHSDQLIDPILQPKCSKKDLHLVNRRLSNKSGALFDCQSLNERNAFSFSPNENYNQLLDQVICSRLNNEFNFEKKRTTGQSSRSTIRSLSPASPGTSLWPLNSKEHLNSLLRLDAQKGLFDWNAFWASNKEKTCKLKIAKFKCVVQVVFCSSEAAFWYF